MGLDISANQRRIEAQLLEQRLHDALELLRRANRYVSQHPTIGGQKLGEEIREFVAAQTRQEK